LLEHSRDSSCHAPESFLWFICLTVAMIIVELGISSTVEFAIA